MSFAEISPVDSLVCSFQVDLEPSGKSSNSPGAGIAKMSARIENRFCRRLRPTGPLHDASARASFAA